MKRRGIKTCEILIEINEIENKKQCRTGLIQNLVLWED